MVDNVPSNFIDTTHDHDVCVDTALAKAERVCRANGANLTTLRKRVLEIVWSGHQPLGAYDILATLSSEGRRAAPPTVYRALEFLLEHGLVHRLASLNAYVGCSSPGHGGQGQFLICEQCGDAMEIAAATISQAIEQAAREHRFVADAHTVEVTGFCSNCATAVSQP